MSNNSSRTDIRRIIRAGGAYQTPQLGSLRTELRSELKLLLKGSLIVGYMSQPRKSPRWLVSWIYRVNENSAKKYHDVLADGPGETHLVLRCGQFTGTIAGVANERPLSYLGTYVRPVPADQPANELVTHETIWGLNGKLAEDDPKGIITRDDIFQRNYEFALLTKFLQRFNDGALHKIVGMIQDAYLAGKQDPAREVRGLAGLYDVAQDGRHGLQLQLRSSTPVTGSAPAKARSRRREKR